MNHRTIAILAVGLLAFATDSTAEWSTKSYENNPVDVQPFYCSSVKSVSDGNGGSLVFYLQPPDEVSPYNDLLMNALDSEGNLAWETPATVFDGTAANPISSYKLVSDGAGGAFLAVEYFAFSSPVVAAQHVNAGGTPLWGPQGIRVVVSPPGIGEQNPVLLADENGGAILCWEDFRNDAFTGFDVWAQRFDAFGTRVWGSGGVSVSSAINGQTNLTICSDSAGGAYVAWEDYRSGTDYDIYGEHLLADGTTAWQLDGKNLYSTPENDLQPALVQASSSGDFFLFLYYSLGAVDQIRGLRFTSLGDWYWNIHIAENLAFSQYSPVAISDGENGAFVCWRDARNTGYSGYQLYLQHLGPGGSSLFGPTGIPAGLVSAEQQSPGLALDGAGGVLVAWSDFRSLDLDIYGQRLSYNGSVLWSFYGQAIGTANYSDSSPSVVSDGRGGLICAWESAREGYYSDAYAQRVGPHGKLGDATPRLTSVADFPQDQGGVVILDWDKSYLDVFPDVGIDHYTVWRRNGGLGKAAESTESFIEERAQELSNETKLDIALLRSQLKAGWNLLDSVDAYFLDEYSYDAPTYADSSGSGVLLTEFRIFAHENTWIYWPSNIVAGYSVDNLAPGMPKALMATYVNPDGLLEWSPSTVSVPDLAGYRVYRSGTPGFTPGPGSFVGSTPDTSYVDGSLSSGTWYYKVTAEDHHDNESVPSNQAELQVSVSGVGDDLPLAFRVGGAVPNPFNPSTSIHFSLAAGGHTTVEVFDARGRLVRRLVDGSMGAGNHEAVWDGCDDQGRGLPSGVYLAQVRSGAECGIIKMILAK